MGIPSYFNHIIQNHKKIFKKLKDFKRIDNLYLDSNSIIYDAMRNIDTSHIRNNIEFEIVLLEKVCLKIKEYVTKLQPSFVYISFDGVAPVAKLEQQRQRRYKSGFIKNIDYEIKHENEIKIKNKKVFSWNQTAITPGTEFMTSLDEYVKSYFKSPEIFGCSNIIVDGSENFGEGEHKIFSYIREHKSIHKDTNTLVYGLDADLIMLCLNHQHISNKINLFREKPDFETDLDKYYDENDICILEIKYLAQTIVDEMMDHNENSNYSLRMNKIRDYILISFMLGNDFMPHFPSLNIRTNGIDTILETYKKVFPITHTICDNDNIKWNEMRKFIEELAKNEYEYLINEYKIRGKRRTYYINKDSSIEDKLKTFNMIPMRERDLELLIDPSQKGWEYRYYKYLFDLSINNDHRRNICNNYLEGLEWTLKYYSSGCINYRWCYKYHYPPLLIDLIKYIPHFDTVFIEENHSVVSKLTQLAYVLPGNSLDLLPDEIRDKLLDKYKSYYSNSYTFTWAFCKYFWECHANLPHIDINEIEQLVKET